MLRGVGYARGRWSLGNNASKLFPTMVPRRNLKGLILGVPKESLEGEHRVAIAPDSVKKLVKAGVTVKIESNAGSGSLFDDTSYKAAGAHIVSKDEAWKSQVVAKV
jgi:hypothetical protein